MRTGAQKRSRTSLEPQTTNLRAVAFDSPAPVVPHLRIRWPLNRYRLAGAVHRCEIAFQFLPPLVPNSARRPATRGHMAFVRGPSNVLQLPRRGSARMPASSALIVAAGLAFVS